MTFKHLRRIGYVPAYDRASQHPCQDNCSEYSTHVSKASEIIKKLKKKAAGMSDISAR